MGLRHKACTSRRCSASICSGEKPCSAAGALGRKMAPAAAGSCFTRARQRRQIRRRGDAAAHRAAEELGVAAACMHKEACMASSIWLSLSVKHHWPALHVPETCAMTLAVESFLNAAHFSRSCHWETR